MRDGATLDRPLRVAVVGGGPAGACTAETLAKGGIETTLIERKLDNCKVWAGLLGAALLFLLFVPHPVINIEDVFNQTESG